MAGYNTEQKKLIIDFLSRNCENSYTIEELIVGLNNEASDSQTVPGRSTVYRLINRMVEEGNVKRFVKGHSRHFYYQCIGSAHCHDHIHMKCTNCGKLFHMDDAITEKLLLEVLSSSHFKVDKEETTLFGTCDHCVVAR
ncbi:MAG: transcriptional repressor [Lachnospiraceae bacterium]|nr:transcriptional repressor [Lachnospiraceae bacterium]